MQVRGGSEGMATHVHKQGKHAGSHIACLTVRSESRLTYVLRTNLSCYTNDICRSLSNVRTFVHRDVRGMKVTMPTTCATPAFTPTEPIGSTQRAYDVGFHVCLAHCECRNPFYTRLLKDYQLFRSRSPWSAICWCPFLVPSFARTIS